MLNISAHYKSIRITDSYSIIFNNLVFKLLLVNNNLKKQISENSVRSDDIRNMLIEYGIYSSEIEDRDRVVDLATQYENRDEEVNTIYIIPTSSCNLNCSYCHVYQNSLKHKPEHMSKKTAEMIASKIIEYFKENSKVEPFIQFYGGEPTLNWEIIELITSKLKEKLKQVEISIITNGTTDLKSKTDFFLKYNVGIGISLDGPEELNNINRRSASKIAYNDILQNIRTLEKNKIRTAISLTVTKEVINNQETIIKWIEELGVRSVNLNFLQCMPWSDNEKISYSDKATDFLIRINRELPNVSNDRLNRKISYFLSGDCVFSDCSAGYGNQITVNPKGDIFICQGEFLNKDKIIGNIFVDSLSEIPKNISSKSHRFIYNNTIYNSDCLNCEALFICGGGCESKRGDVDKDLVFCEHTKKTFIWILEKLIHISNATLNEPIYAIN